MISFGSRNNPIKPFTIQTPLGKLSVAELKASDIRQQKPKDELAKLIIDNFMEGSTDPNWNGYKVKDSPNYNKQVKAFGDYCADLFEKDTGDLTFLVAKNENTEMKAAYVLKPFDEIKGLEDVKTGHIDMFVVDKNYRGANVGATIFKKSLKTARATFTDILLEGYRRAVPFYEGLGFKKLNTKNPAIKAASDLIEKTRTDSPTHVKLMSKPIKRASERWWQRAFFKMIKNAK